MGAQLARLQLPLLFLPLVVLGLGVFGSDFDETPGRIFIALFAALPVLDLTLGRRVERLGRGAAASWIALFGIPVAALAYRPVHLDYWDEHSTAQALAFFSLGLFSWAIWRIGAGRERSSSGAPATAGALVVLGLCWLSAILYPLLPTLALGAVFAVLAVAFAGRGDSSPEEAACAEHKRARLDRIAAWAAVLGGIDLFLVVWDYRWVSAWAPHLALALAGAALGRILASRLGGVLLGLGAVNFLVAALFRPWVLEHSHSVIVGLALGAALARVSRGALGRWTVLWTVGIGVGLGIWENLVVADWRALLLLPPLLFAYHSHRALRIARSS